MMMTAGAHAVFIIMMLMMVLVLVMVMVVMTAGAGFAVVMMMLMLLMLVVVVMVVTAGAGFTVMMMVVMLLVLVQLSGVEQSLVTVCTHDIVNLLTGQVIPRRGDDAGVFPAVLTNQLESLVQTLVADILGAAQHNGAGAFQLIDIELTEVLDIHAALGSVAYGGHAAHFHFAFAQNRLYSGSNVGQLADAGRLNDDAIRCVLAQDIAQCLFKVADQSAADAAGVHFVDLNAGILQETAVNADFTELVFDQNHFLTLERAFQQFANQGRLAGAQETGNNVDFRHIKHLL